MRLIGVEAAGEGVDTERHAATLTKGRIGVLHGAASYLLQDEHGQITEAHSISADWIIPVSARSIRRSRSAVARNMYPSPTPTLWTRWAGAPARRELSLLWKLPMLSHTCAVSRRRWAKTK